MILDTVKKLFGYREPDDDDIEQKKEEVRHELRRIEIMAIEAKLHTRNWDDTKHDKPT